MKYFILGLLLVGIYAQCATTELSDAGCVECTGDSASRCDKCDEETYLNDEGACVDSASCPADTFPITTAAGNLCTGCSGISNCAACTNTGCPACDASYFLYKGSCWQPCPATTFSAKGTGDIDICTDCNTVGDCADCSGSGVCTRCVSPYYFLADTCTTNCGTGKYKDESLVDDFRCSECSTIDADCTECAVDGSCTKCGTLYLDTAANECVAAGQCPGNTFAEPKSTGNVCTLCTSKFTDCAACTALGCDDCGNLFKEGGGCVSDCSSGTYKDAIAKTCADCAQASNCETCDSDLSTCLSCSGNYYLEGIACGTTCSGNKFKNPANHECDDCTEDCETCEGTSAYCLTCTDGDLYADDGACVTECTGDKTPNDDTMTCESDEPGESEDPNYGSYLISGIAVLTALLLFA